MTKRMLFAWMAIGLACGASAAVEWRLTGPDKSAVGRFAKVLAEQTGTESVRTAGSETYVFHCGADDFAKDLKLDLASLHPYGYYIAIRGRDVVLAGRTRSGTAYAAFDFLKRHTGYRSFGGRLGEIVPKIEKLDLPDELTVREEPDVISCNIAGATGADGAFTRGGRLTCRATHAMSHMVKKDMYEAHPEYFALVHGKRLKPGTGPCNPCMSNPDLPDLFRAYARDFFRRNPDALGIPMGVNDGGGDCDCDGCRAIYAKHGNQYVEFYNAAAKILAEEFPGKYLAFIAYSVRCSQAPKDGLRMEPNILVEVTGYANTYAAWKKAGVRNFGTYEYLYALNGSRMAPACYTHHIADYLRAQRHTYGLNTFWEEYFCGSPLIDAGRQYVVNELMWNMDADVDALLDDYHRAMFGAAAAAMREFSDICEEAFADNPARTRYQDEYHNPIQFNGYTFERIARIDAVLAKAAKAVKAGTPEARRIELITKLWGAMRLLMDNWQVAKALAKTDDPDEIVRLIRRGLADIDAFRDYMISPADDEDAFLNTSKLGFRKWKAQADSRFAPLPPLEKAADAAFARLAEKLGQEKARAFFAPLAHEPGVGVFAATQLRLMDGEPENLIANGSFEELDASAERNPSGASDWHPFGQAGGWNWWHFPSAAAQAWTDETEAHDGRRSVVIGENVLGCSILNSWQVEPRCRYRLSFWVKRNDAAGGAKGLGGFSIRMANGAGKWIDAGSAIGCKVPEEAIGKWVKLTVIFTTPERDDGVRIVPIFGAPRQGPDSRLWLDDVRLERLCAVPCPLAPQVAFAQETLRKWTSGWNILLPTLSVDEGIVPTGAFRATRDADGKVVITGGDEGLRIGLYTWAKARGIRWFSPGEEPIVPECPSSVSEGFFRLHVPSFPYRGLHVCGSKDHFDPTVAHWMSFMGMNRRLDDLDEALRNAAEFRKYGLVSDTTVHSYSLLVPKDRYFRDHPEFFALLGGKRKADGGQRCLANAEFRKAFVAELRKWIACEPNVSPVGICPNDGYGWCECAACKALDTEEDRKTGTVNGRVADFVKYVCSALPDQTIGHYSYSNFADFYKLIDPLPKNLKLSFTAFHCQSHVLCDGNCPENGKFRRRIRELKAKGADFYVYDYYVHRWGVLPAPMWQYVSREFKSLKEEGVSGFLSECGNAKAGHWASFWPAFYTAATMLYDADTDVDGLVEDWCRVRYGKAAEPMLAYFREWEKAFDGSWCWTKSPDQFKRVFRPEAEKFLDAARAADPENAAVARACKQYAWWKENLRLRETYPVVREVTVSDALAKLPLHFVSGTTQVPDLANNVDVEMAAADGKVRIRLTAHETRMDALKVGKGPYSGDNFEIFFADGRGNGTSYHFIVDSAARISAAESLKTRWNWSWEHHATAKVTKTADAWTLDFTMPLSDVHATGDFAFTLIRNRYAGGRWEITGAPAGGAFFKTEDYVKVRTR